ncbi:hypothetical protein B5V02_08845 [Mesorhizobium kowhaii]|uniref:Uncharacterized protein n=1 Tax=Mesorhizobium kowhaii TaxID=1300272 RepID=A0A2W7CQN1_9HYPH|nr:hypothetical protein B5V02_08845 [Mesorhizobium kowhaii]
MKARRADERLTGQSSRRTYRRPKKLNITNTMTTAPTSQMMLFMISLRLLREPAPLAQNADRPAIAG